MAAQVVRLKVTETNHSSDSSANSIQQAGERKQKTVLDKFKKAFKTGEDQENRLVKGFAEHVGGSMTFSQSLVPFAERINNLEVLGKLFKLDCTITDLVEESMRRVKNFKKNESCADTRTAEQKVDQAIQNMKNPMTKVLHDIISVGRNNRFSQSLIAPVHRKQLSRMTIDFSEISDEDVHQMLRDAIHGSSFMKTAPNETSQKVVQLLDILGPTPMAKYVVTAQQVSPQLLTQDNITNRMHVMFKSQKVENDIKKSLDDETMRKSINFDPKKKTYGQARPTQQIIDSHQQIIKGYKFREDIDNSSEDNFSDDELIAKIKVTKCKARIKRADMTTENEAITQIIKGVEKARQKVAIKSIVESGINLINLKARQAKLRRMIDDDEETQEEYHKDAYQLPVMTPEVSEISFPIRGKPYKASFLSNLSPIQQQRAMYGKRLTQFNKEKSTLASKIDELLLSNKIYDQVHKIYTARSRALTQVVTSVINTHESTCENFNTEVPKEPLENRVKQENSDMKVILLNSLSMISGQSIPIGSKKDDWPKRYTNSQSGLEQSNGASGAIINDTSRSHMQVVIKTGSSNQEFELREEDLSQIVQTRHGENISTMVGMPDHSNLIEQNSSQQLAHQEPVQSLLLSQTENRHIKPQKSEVFTSRSEKSDFLVTRFGESSILNSTIRKVPITNLVINTLAIKESRGLRDSGPFQKFQNTQHLFQKNERIAVDNKYQNRFASQLANPYNSIAENKTSGTQIDACSDTVTHELNHSVIPELNRDISIVDQQKQIQPVSVLLNPKSFIKNFDLNKLGTSYDNKIYSTINTSISSRLPAANLKRAIALERQKREKPAKDFSQSLFMPSITLAKRQHQMPNREAAGSQLENPLNELNEDTEDSTDARRSLRHYKSILPTVMMTKENQTSMPSPDATQVDYSKTLSVIEEQSRNASKLQFISVQMTEPLLADGSKKLAQRGFKGFLPKRRSSIKELEQTTTAVVASGPSTPTQKVEKDYEAIKTKEIYQSFSLINFGDAIIAEHVYGQLKGALAKPNIKYTVPSPNNSPKAHRSLPKVHDKTKNNLKLSFGLEGPQFIFQEQFVDKEVKLQSLPPGHKKSITLDVKSKKDKPSPKANLRVPAPAAFILKQKFLKKSPSGHVNNMTMTSEINDNDIDTFHQATVGLSNSSFSNDVSKASFIAGLTSTKSNYLLQTNAAHQMRKRVKVISKRNPQFAEDIAIQTFEIEMHHNGSLEIFGSTVTPTYQMRQMNPRSLETTRMSKDSSDTQ